MNCVKTVVLTGCFVFPLIRKVVFGTVPTHSQRWPDESFATEPMELLLSHLDV